jgi:hypothetical protein
MTLDLEPIKRRAEWMTDSADLCGRSPGQVSLSGYVAACIDCGRDVPVLIAEVERLRAEVANEMAMHAKTYDNLEAFAESHQCQSDEWLREFARLKDVIAKAQGVPS